MCTPHLSQVTGRSGFANASVLLPAAIGVVLLALFVVHGLRPGRVQALVNLSVFRIRSYAAAVTVLFLAGLSLYGPLLLLALFYQQVQHQSPLWTGLLLAPQGIGSLLPRTLVGKLTDRIGPRPIVFVGLVLTALGTIAFTQADAETNKWFLAAALMVRGAGLGSATIAVMAGAFQEVPRGEVPDASSTTRIVQQIGGSFGAAVLATILAQQLALHAERAVAYDVAFWWAIGFAAIALVPALFLAGRPRAPAALE